MNQIINYILVIVFAIPFFSSCNKKDESKDKSKSTKPIVVDWVVAKETKLSDDIHVSGTIKPFEETVLFSEISGRIVWINFEEGKFVKKGTLLVKLFDNDLQAQLKKSAAQLKLAEQTSQRQAQLLKINGISQADYDQTVYQINAINGDIEVLKAQIRKTEIIAPYDGRLGLRNVSLGTVVSPSFALTAIRDVQKLKIDFSVPEKYSTNVHVGSKIKFAVNGSKKEFDARVIATEEGIDASSRNLKSRAIISQPNANLTPGAFATISLIVAEKGNAIVIPSQAIIPQEKSKKVIIFENGKAKFVNVKVGLRQTAGVEITEGISPNDTVVVSGVMFVKPNDSLKLKERKDKFIVDSKIAGSETGKLAKRKKHKEK